MITLRRVMAVAIVVAALAGMLARSRATPAAEPSPTTTTVVEVGLPPITSPPPTVPSIDTQPADAHMTAVRLDPPDPVPAPSACGPDVEAAVNSLPYAFDDKVPTTIAYELVATCLNEQYPGTWSPATIAFYRSGIIDDIFPGESRQCPWHMNGQGAAPDCTPTGTPRGSDAGFFQITAGTRAAVTCQFGYCTAHDIIRSAWHSMRAGLLLIMVDGRRPWCYSTDSCNYHRLVARWPRWFTPV